MFCLELFSGQSGLCAATIIFYTCIWIPFQRMKQSVSSMFLYVTLHVYSAAGWSSYSNSTSTAGVSSSYLHHHHELQMEMLMSSSSSPIVVTAECLEEMTWQLNHYRQQQAYMEGYLHELVVVVDGRINSEDTHHHHDEDELCSVCLGELFQGRSKSISRKGEEVEEEVVRLKLSGCGHVFHGRCIKSWLQFDHFTCPLCRSSVFCSNSSSISTE